MTANNQKEKHMDNSKRIAELKCYKSLPNGRKLFDAKLNNGLAQCNPSAEADT